MAGIFDRLGDMVTDTLGVRDRAREQALPRCREVIRHCSKSIRATHRQDFTGAEALLTDAKRQLDEARQAITGYADLLNTGFLRDAEKEYAEGAITLAIVRRQPLPEPDELGVDLVAYLGGMAEAAGELRRYLLDAMRAGDLSRGEELLTMMDDIYGLLITVDYPDAITGGLRRITDMVRGVLEKTRSDLTLAIRQKELENRL
ncbi:haloacid dehalogenase [Chloroflexota bacterium]